MERKLGTGSKIKQFTACAAIVMGGGFYASSARAVIITPGGSLTPTGTAAVSGSEIYHSNTPFTGLDFLGDVSFSGSLASEVFQQGNGTLQFVYAFSNDPIVTNDAIERFTVDDFTGFSTDADYTAGAGTAPSTVTRQNNVTGDVIGYDFAGVAPGSATDVLIVQTNATNFQIGSAAFQDGGNVTIPAPVPAAAVPEPACIGLIAIALSGLALRRNKIR